MDGLEAAMVAFIPNLSSHHTFFAPLEPFCLYMIEPSCLSPKNCSSLASEVAQLEEKGLQRASGMTVPSCKSRPVTKRWLLPISAWKGFTSGASGIPPKSSGIAAWPAALAISLPWEERPSPHFCRSPCLKTGASPGSTGSSKACLGLRIDSM